MRLVTFVLGCIALTLSAAAVGADTAAPSWKDLNSLMRKHDSSQKPIRKFTPVGNASPLTKVSLLPKFATLSESDAQFTAAVAHLRAHSGADGVQSIDFLLRTNSAFTEAVDATVEVALPVTLSLNFPSCELVPENSWCSFSLADNDAYAGVRRSLSMPSEVHDFPLSIPFTKSANHGDSAWSFTWAVSASPANPVGGSLLFNNGGIPITSQLPNHISSMLPAGYGPSTSNSDKTMAAGCFTNVDHPPPPFETLNEAQMTTKSLSDAPTDSETLLSAEVVIDMVSIQFSSWIKKFAWACEASITDRSGTRWPLNSSERALPATGGPGTILYFDKPIQWNEVKGVHFKCSVSDFHDRNMYETPTVTLGSSVFGPLESFDGYYATQMDSTPSDYIMSASFPLKDSVVPDTAALLPLFTGDLYNAKADVALGTMEHDDTDISALNIYIMVTDLIPAAVHVQESIVARLQHALDYDETFLPIEPAMVQDFGGFYGLSAGSDPSHLVHCGSATSAICFVHYNDYDFASEAQGTLPCHFATPPTEDLECTLPFAVAQPSFVNENYAAGGTVDIEFRTMHFDPTGAYADHNVSAVFTFPEGVLQQRTYFHSMMAVGDDQGNLELEPTVRGNTVVVPLQADFFASSQAGGATPVTLFLTVHSNLVIEGEFTVSVDMRSTSDVGSADAASSLLVNSPYAMSYLQGLNYIDNHASVDSTFSQEGGVLTIGLTSFMGTWLSNPNSFRVSGPGVHAAPNCTAFVAVKAYGLDGYSYSEALLPFLTEPSDSDHPGFTKLTRPVDGSIYDYTFRDYMIITCPDVFPADSEIKVYLSMSAPLAMLASAPRTASRAAAAAATTVAPTVAGAAASAGAAMKTLADDDVPLDLPGPQRGYVLVGTGTVKEATEEAAEFCHRGEFTITFVQFTPVSATFDTLSAKNENGVAAGKKKDAKKAAAFATASFDDQNAPDEDDRNRAEMIRDGFSRFFKKVISPDSYDVYYYRYRDHFVLRICSAENVEYKPEIVPASAPFATLADDDDESLPNPEFWKLAVNAATRMAISSPSMAAYLSESALNPAVLQAYSRGAFMAAAPADKSQPFVSVPRSEIDFKCAATDMSGAHRDNCVFERCTRDLITPELCYTGTTVHGRDEECYMFGTYNDVRLNGCDWSIQDVAFNAEIGDASGNAVLTFRLVAGSLADLRMADNLTFAFTLDLPESYVAEAVKVSANGTEPFDNAPYEAVDADDVKMMRFEIDDTTEDLAAVYRISFTSDQDVHEIIDNLVRSTRMVFINTFYGMPNETAIFDSSAAFGSRAGTASSASGDAFSLIGSRGSLAHVPGLEDSVSFEVFAPYAQFTDCEFAQYPTVATGMTELLPASWSSDAVTTAPAPGSHIDTLISMPSSASSLAGVAFRCTGGWSEHSTNSTLIVLAARSSADNLLYGAHTAPLTAYTDDVTRVLHGTIRATAAPAAATARLAALVPAWAADSIRVAAVTLPEASGETRAIVFQAAKGAQMYFPTALALYEVVKTALGAPMDHAAVPAGEALVAEYLDNGAAGVWGCDTAGDETYTGVCSTPNSCSATFDPALGCATPEGASIFSTLEANVACAFDVAPVPDYSGCGVLMCAGATENDFIPCSESTACVTGCTADVELTAVVIATIPALAPVCVKDGAVVDTATFCPESGVEAVTYPATCNATSSCGTVCLAADNTVVSCTSNEAWGPCSTTCGTGTQTKNEVCGDVQHNGPLPLTPAPHSFCGWSQAPSTSRACEDLSCPGYAYLCTPTGADETVAPADCDTLGFAACPVDACGAATMTRNVVCVAGGSMVVDSSKCVDAGVSPVPEASSVCPLVTTQCTASFVPDSLCYDADNQVALCAPADAPLPTREGVCIDAAGAPVNSTWCAAGSLRQDCDDLPACDSDEVVVFVTRGVDPGDYIIRWTVPSSVPAGALASIDIVDVSEGENAGASRVLGSFNAADKQVAFNARAYGFPQSNYTAVVTIDPLAPGVSNVFAIVVVCVETPCQNDGVCVHATGFCECNGDWSGLTCEISPCTQKGCNPDGGSCSVTAAGIAVCDCNAAFSGPLCLTPSQGCDDLPTCANGGVRGGVLLPNSTEATCSDCVCEGNWTPASDCEECGYGCFNQGERDEYCSRCTCLLQSGYHGDHCHCRHAFMTFVVLAEKLPFDESAMSSADRDIALTIFASAFAKDFSDLTKIIKVTVDFTAVRLSVSPKGVRSYSIGLWVGPPCPSPPALGSSGAVADSVMLPTYDGIVDLKRALNDSVHLTMISFGRLHVESGFGANDPNCALGDDCPTGWRRGGVFVDADDSTGEGPDPGGEIPGSKSGLSTGAIVGIAVGASIFVLILIGTLVSACCGYLCFAGRKKMTDENST